MNSIFDSPEFNQNLFFPRPDHSQCPQGAEDIFVDVEDGIQVHVRRHITPGAEFTLLYFHGNGEIASDYDTLGEPFAHLGAELVVCDYRGYGQSQGMPTLRRVLQDAHRIHNALKLQGKLKDRVMVMGRSLGSASAIELCIHTQGIAGCIIESGYADPIPLVERRGLKIDSTTPEENALFNNSEKISKLSCPLLIMHGQDDFLIEPREAEMNYEQAGSSDKTLEILEGVGHNDILASPQYFPVLHRFITKVLN